MPYNNQPYLMNRRISKIAHKQIGKKLSPKNQNRELLAWKKDITDRVCLKELIENSIITGMGPKKVIELHIQFQKYS